MKIQFFYPEAIFYARGADKAPIAYQCETFFEGPTSEEMELYRRVTRISDGAYQVFKASVSEGTSQGTVLYGDPQFEYRTDFVIPGDNWTWPPRFSAVLDQFKRKFSQLDKS